MAKREGTYRGRFPEDDDQDRVVLGYFAVGILLFSGAVLLGVVGAWADVWLEIALTLAMTIVAVFLGGRYARLAIERRHRRRDAAQLLRATNALTARGDRRGSGGPGARGSSGSS